MAGKTLASGWLILGVAFVLIGLEDNLQFLKVLLLTNGAGIGAMDLVILAGSLLIILIGAVCVSVASKFFRGGPIDMTRVGMGVVLYLLVLGLFGIERTGRLDSVAGPFSGAALLLTASWLHKSKRSLAGPLSGFLLLALSLSLLLDTGYSGRIFLEENALFNPQAMGLFLSWRPAEVSAVALLGVAQIIRSREGPSWLIARMSMVVYAVGILISFYQVPGQMARLVVGDPGDPGAFARSTPIIVATILFLVGSASVIIGAILVPSARQVSALKSGTGIQP